MKAFILTGGLGTRLRKITDQPKALVDVGGKPVIWYIRNHLIKHGIRKHCINLHYKPSKFILYLGDEVMYSYEPELLGTAGALRKAKGWLSDPFIVMNGDTVTDVGLRGMLRFARDRKKVATVFTHDDAIHNGGTFIFSKRVFDYIQFLSSPIEPLSIHEVLLPHLLKKAEVALYKSNANYWDIGTPKGLKKAKGFFEGEKKSSHLSKL